MLKRLVLLVSVLCAGATISGSTALAQALAEPETQGSAPEATHAHAEHAHEVPPTIQHEHENGLEVESLNLDNLTGELFSRLVAKLLSENDTSMLSGNETQAFSGNDAKLFSENQVEAFSGNVVNVFSNVRFDIRVSVSGLPGKPGSGKPVKIEVRTVEPKGPKGHAKSPRVSKSSGKSVKADAVELD